MYMYLSHMKYWVMDSLRKSDKISRVHRVHLLYEVRFKRPYPCYFQNEEQLREQFREIEILRAMKHFAIVRYLDSYKNGIFSIVMEFCDQGNLEELILKKVVLSYPKYLNTTKTSYQSIHELVHNIVKSANDQGAN